MIDLTLSILNDIFPFLKPSQYMVLLNLLSLTLLGIIILISKYIFKVKINYLLILLVIMIISISGIFRTGMYESGSLWIHVSRLIEFYTSLTEGNLKPIWAPVLNATYGYPILMFTAPLMYYVSSFFHFIGFNYILSMKLFLAISFIFAGFTMYLWGKNRFGVKIGFIVALAYTFSPYHLIDTHFRVSIGETALFLFIPLILYGIDTIYNAKNTSYYGIALTAISLSLAILVSPTTLAVAIFAFAYSIFTYQIKISKTIHVFSSFILGLSLSSFYWIPVLLETKYTTNPIIHDSIIFHYISDIFLPINYFGFLLQGSNGWTYFYTGHVQLVFIFLSIALILFNKINLKNRKLLIFLLSSFFIIVFLMLPVSEMIWNKLSFFNFLQFTFRLLVIVSFITSAIIGIVLLPVKRNSIFLAVALLIIFTSLLNWNTRKVIPSQQDVYMLDQLPYSTSRGEVAPIGMPKWTTNANQPSKTEIPDSKTDIISGSGTIKNLSINSTSHTYLVYADEKLKITENTLYFPGWKVNINNNEVAINYELVERYGLINYEIPNKGLYLVEVKYRDLPSVIFSKLISVFSLFLLIIILLIGFKYEKRK